MRTRGRLLAVLVSALIAWFSVIAPAQADHEIVAGSALYSDGSTSKVVMEGIPTDLTVYGVNVPPPLPGGRYVLMAGTRGYPNNLPCYGNRRILRDPVTRHADGTIAPVTFNTTELEGLGIDHWELCFYEQPFRFERTTITNPVLLYLFSTTH